nr:Heavy metal-associated domain, HMA [Ipomoea batatas]
MFNIALLQKFVLRLELSDSNDKRKALKTIAALPGDKAMVVIQIHNIKEIVVLGVRFKQEIWFSWQLLSLFSAINGGCLPRNGIDEIAMDMNSKQVTVIGNVDPVTVVSKLRKHWTTGIISVGPAKEPEKKEEPKKEEPKKEEEKKEEPPKEEGKKEGEAKKEEGKKDDEKKEPVVIMPYYRQYYYPPVNSYYNYAHHHSIEENPNACVIC